MYPYIKLARVLWQARSRPPMALNERSQIQLRAGLTDVDIFGELNNARHLVVMELARWDFSQRSGLVGLIRQKGWGLVVGGASVRYRRRVPLWSKYTVSCEGICHDGRWFYCLQEVHRAEQICSSGLLKVGITGPEGLVPAPEVLAALGEPDWGASIPDWVSAWIEAEGQRPWPSSG